MQEIVEIVRDAARQLSDSFEPPRACKRLLVAFALGNVAKDCGEEALAFAVAPSGHRDIHRDFLAVFALRFYLLDCAGFRESLERRRHQNAEALSNQFFGGVAENARSGAVGGLDFSFAVHDYDAIGRCIDDGAEPLFAFAKRLLGAFAVGDVENEPVDTALARYGSHFGARISIQRTAPSRDRTRNSNLWETSGSSMAPRIAS